MERQGEAANVPPHILIFPLPLQGHVNSMLNLAELLCLSDLHVTVLLTEHIDSRLQSRCSGYPTSLRVATISDGLPADHPRTAEFVPDTILSLFKVGGLQFRNLMQSTDGLSDGGARRRVNCLIIDGGWNFAEPVIDEMGIPYIYFRTISACSFWSYLCIQEVIDAGEIPLKGKEEDKFEYWNKQELDLKVRSIPGMETVLRRRDLPGLFRVANVNDSIFQYLKAIAKRDAQCKRFILNTFEDLEGPVLDRIREHIPDLYSIGPIHANLKARLESNVMEPRSSSLWEEDHSCMAWLDSQPNNYVLYVSFGSIIILTREELLEFWYGLINSGHRFLWVIRPDFIIGNESGRIPTELEDGTRLRGFMVGWAPQQEVLAHRAVGAFFNGIRLWKAYFADQMTNSRFVSEVWRIGLDMKDTCNRILIEKMIRDVMGVRREEFLERAGDFGEEDYF